MAFRKSVSTQHLLPSGNHGYIRNLGRFLYDCKGSSASPIMSKKLWSSVNILLTKNAFEHVHLEDELVQNQLHIAGRLT